MKAVLSGLALSTAVFAAHAEPPVVDKDAQTITWTIQRTGERNTLNCRFGVLSITNSDRAGSMNGGVGISTSAVDIASGNNAREIVARKICKDNGLTPGF